MKYLKSIPATLKHLLRAIRNRPSHQDDSFRYGFINRLSNQLIASPLWSDRIFLAGSLSLSFLALAYIILIPFSLAEQSYFAGFLFIIALILRRYTGKVVSLILIGMSMIASTRYMIWRIGVTPDFAFDVHSFFSTGLVLAEMYAWLVLVFGFAQTIWPLRRKPEKLPDDNSTWPTIAILIPTYNEPLSVVRPTVFAAMAQDWPKDKLKVYILDDGRRDEFAEFAAQVGVTHITRDNNRHAKAGNINQALPKTEGEIIAIFDCDHIPNRSFLQLTTGWFLKDPKLAMLQTPHHFLSPDPFERNLGTFRKTPNEGQLFYGLIQDGNDLWNATFFCGSCALIRRKMLLEVGGIAVETVTEDAHTALKLSRLGYNTAYLNITQAAGLATESLSAHVGQRIRWARGMAQIARIDNPLFGPGLSPLQRICYLNAMLHFFYGIPRLIFLTAPLAFLFFGAYVIESSAVMILAFALPHLAHAFITNAHSQGKFRHSFWAEVYETALAWYILLPTTLAVINPKLGKFNVTAKGGQVMKEYFDWRIAMPYVVLFFLNIAGIVVGLYQTSQPSTDEGLYSTTMVNIFWSIYNLVIIGATIGVALETRQIRRSWRVRLNIPAMLRLSSGRTIACMTTDFSEGGVALELPGSADVAVEDEIQVTLFRGLQEYVLPGRCVFNRGTVFRVRFDDFSLQQYGDLVAATFSRADIWQGWMEEEASHHQHSALRGLRDIFLFSLTGIQRMFVSGADAIWQKIRRRFKGERPSTQTQT